ncbi:MAG: radical SAM protein [Thermoplasmata archaeon]
MDDAKARLVNLFEDFSNNFKNKKDDDKVIQPRSFVFRVTNRCNLRCKYCASNSSFERKKEKEDELSISDWESIIEECARLGLRKVALSGGEPFCRNDIFEIISFIRKKGMKVKVNTSGWFINEEVAKRLKSYGVSTVQISVLSSKKELHDKLKGKKGSHERALAAIRNCKKEGLNVLFSTIAIKQNIDDIPNMAKICDELGVYFYVKRYHPAGRAYANLGLAPSKEEFRKTILFLKEYYGEELTNSFCKYTRALRGSCLAGLSLCILSDGKVTPCAELPIVIGDLRKESIKDIWYRAWNTDPCVSIRKREGLNSKCANCKMLDICGGGCRADAYGFTEDIKGEDPYCWLGDSWLGDSMFRIDGNNLSDIDKDKEPPPMLNMLGLYFGWLGN